MSRAADAAGADVDADQDDLYEADLALAEVAEAMEVVDWTVVPTISTAEAAALAARLREARDACLEAAQDATQPDPCRLPGCDEPSRGTEDARDGHAARYCSDQCEAKHEHVKDDARDAMRAEGRR